MDHGLKGSDPLIFWDAFGFKQTHSGIYQHARALGSELLEQNLHPILLVQKKTGRLERDFSSTHMVELSQLVYGHAKSIWPIRSFQSALNFAKKIQCERMIFHGLGNVNLPLFNLNAGKSIRFVLTVHDLIPLLLRHQVSHSQYAQTKFLLPRLLKKADAVVCVSQWTKESLLEFFPECKSRIHLIPNGVTSNPRQISIGLLAKKAAAQPRLLSVARFEPYKRIELLLSIVGASNAKIECDLVTDEKGETFCLNRAPKLVHSNRLRIHKSIDSDALSLLYQRAHIYLQPSIAEGFALPVAEALSHGCGVLFTRGHALDEWLKEPFGIGLDQTAGAEEWLASVSMALKNFDGLGWQKQISEFVLSLASWKDSALALKSLYGQLFL